MRENREPAPLRAGVAVVRRRKPFVKEVLYRRERGFPNSNSRLGYERSVTLDHEMEIQRLLILRGEPDSETAGFHFVLVDITHSSTSQASRV